MLEPGRRDEGGPRPLPLQESVRGDRRAVCEALDAFDPERRGSCDDRLLLASRGGNLRGSHLVVGDEHGVREGAADIDSQRTHVAILKSRAQ